MRRLFATAMVRCIGSRVFGLALLLIGPAAVLAQDCGFRTWTDTEGRQIEAVFLGFEDGVVTLGKRDGQAKTVPIEKLSEVDQQHVRKATAEPEPQPVAVPEPQRRYRFSHSTSGKQFRGRVLQKEVIDGIPRLLVENDEDGTRFHLFVTSAWTFTPLLDPPAQRPTPHLAPPRRQNPSQVPTENEDGATVKPPPQAALDGLATFVNKRTGKTGQGRILRREDIDGRERLLVEPVDRDPDWIWADEWDISSPTTPIIEVVVTGAGATLDEAQQNAYSRAIEQTMGVLIDAETRVANDQLLQEEILKYSRGWVHGRLEPVGKPWEEDGLHYVRMRARVAADRIARHLEASKIKFEAVPKELLLKDVKHAARIDTVIRRCSLDRILKLSIDGEPTEEERDEIHAKLRFRVNIAADLKEWNRIRADLCRVLGDASSNKTGVWLEPERRVMKLKWDNNTPLWEVAPPADPIIFLMNRTRIPHRVAPAPRGARAQPGPIPRPNAATGIGVRWDAFSVPDKLIGEALKHFRQRRYRLYFRLLGPKKDTVLEVACHIGSPFDALRSPSTPQFGPRIMSTTWVIKAGGGSGYYLGPLFWERGPKLDHTIDIVVPIDLEQFPNPEEVSWRDRAVAFLEEVKEDRGAVPAVNVAIAARPMPLERKCMAVLATGIGVGYEDAVDNALLHAAEEAVGVLIDAETIVDNDKIFREEILTNSSAFVQKHTVIADKRVQGLHSVQVRATVELSELADRLRPHKIAVRSLPGDLIRRRIIHETEAEKDAEKMICKAMGRLEMDKLLEVKDDDKWTETRLPNDQVELQLTFTLSPNAAAWKDFHANLRPKLEKLALRRAVFVSVAERRERGQDASELVLSRDYGGRRNLECFVRDGGAVVFLLRAMSSTGFSTYWDVYQVPPGVMGAGIAKARQRPYALRIRLLDANNQVLMETVEPLDGRYNFAFPISNRPPLPACYYVAPLFPSTFPGLLRGNPNTYRPIVTLKHTVTIPVDKLALVRGYSGEVR